LTEILESKDTDNEFTLAMPLPAGARTPVAKIYFTKAGLELAAKHAHRRSAYFNLLAREPNALRAG
jgi:hypothetical protein